MNEPFEKPTPWRSKKYRDAAKGQSCTMRLPGCTNDRATVVLAHRNGAGMGTKASDHDAADMDFYCHSIFDRPDMWPYAKDKMISEFERARVRTLVNRIERGILK